MFSYKFPILSILIVLLTCMALAPCYANPLDLIAVDKADTADDVLSFIEEETIHAATGFSRPTFSSTANVFVLTREDIEKAQAHHLVDVFRLIPGLDVFHVSRDDFNVSACGLGSQYSNLILVLLDGAPVITARYGETPWRDLPLTPSDIERVEVVLGPSTSLYGENAFSGVVDIITRKSMEETKSGAKAQVTIGTGGLKRMQATASHKTKNTVIDTRFTADQSIGLTQTSQQTGVNSLKSERLDARRKWINTSIRRQLDKYRNLGVEIGFSEVQSGSRDLFSGLPHEGDERFFFGVARYKEQINPSQEFRFRFEYFAKRNEGKRGDFATSLGNAYEEDLIDLDLSKLVDYRKLRSIFGFTFRGKSAEGELAPGKHEVDTRSFYYQAEYDLDKDWSIFGSLRYFDHTLTDGDISWKLDARKRLSAQEMIRFGTGHAIRFPDIVSMYLMPTSMLGAMPLNIPGLLPGQNLDNEDISSITVGYEKRNKDSTFKLDLFEYEAKNLITPISNGIPVLFQPLPFPFPGIPSGFVQHQFQNLDSPLRTRGVTVFWKKKLSNKFTILVQGSKRNTKFKNDAARVPAYSPDLNASGSLIYRPDKRNLFQITLHHMDEIRASHYGYDPFTFEEIPSYNTIDLSWSRNFERGKLGFRVTNLTDREILGVPEGTNEYSPIVDRQMSLSWTVEF